MPIRNTWIPGAHLVECDRTGFVVYSYQSKKEWTGHIVRDESWEPRHPQDFVRGIGDKQSVYDPRPQHLNNRVGPLVIHFFADASIGDTNLIVSATEGLSIDFLLTEGGVSLTTEAGDALIVEGSANYAGGTFQLTLNNDIMRNTLISTSGGTATGGFHITVGKPLTGDAFVGKSIMFFGNIITATGGF